MLPRIMFSRCVEEVALGLFCLLLPVSLYAAPDVIHLKPSQKAVHLSAQTVLELAPETDSIPIIAEASHVKVEPGASAMILLDEGRTVVLPNFTSLTRYHEIIKLMDQSAVQNYSEFPLTRPTSTAQTTIERARVIKADGTVQDITGNALHFSINLQQNFLPILSLSPGDLLDISYHLEDHNPDGLAHQFWCGWNFNGTNTPSRLSRYVLITPTSMTYTTRHHGTIPDPTAQNSGDWNIREWRMTDLPAIPSEVLGTNVTESGIWLDISTVPSWAVIAEWYASLSAPRCVPDAAVSAEAAELTKKAKTDDEKIRAVYAYVTHEIKYQNIPFRLGGYVPAEGQKVIRQGYGKREDKAALLTALLAAIGVKSEMVLLIGRSQGLARYLPSPRFGYVITRIQTSRGPLYVDPNADQLGFGVLSAEDQGVPALIVAPTTTDLTETPTQPIENNRSDEIYADTLDADGTLHGTLDSTLTDRLAWGLRLTLQQVPDAKRDEELQGLAGFLIKNAVCGSASVEHLTEPDLPLQFHFTYKVDHDALSAGSFLLMPLPWASESRNKLAAALAAEPKRMQDLEVLSIRSHTHAIAHISLPSGYSPQELPAEVHQESPFGSFQMQYKFEGGILMATRDVDFAASRVPASDVPSYTAFLKAMNAEITRQIVLKKM